MNHKNKHVQIIFQKKQETAMLQLQLKQQQVKKISTPQQQKKE